MAGNPIDIEVGRRLRTFRMERGITQEKLAEACDITFQQIQKYEKGVNRIGASRLQQIADFLGLAPAAFFPDSTGAAVQPELFADAQTFRLIRNFARIADPALRRALAQTIAAAAGAAGEPEAT